MDQNEVKPIEISINTKLLNSLQPEWSKYVTLTRQKFNLKKEHYDALYDYLSQFEPHVKVSKENKVAKNHDPLALVSNSLANNSYSHASPSYSRLPQPYYVTHPSSEIDYDDDYQWEIQGDAQKDKFSTAMMLLTRAIIQHVGVNMGDGFLNWNLWLFIMSGLLGEFGNVFVGSTVLGLSVISETANQYGIRNVEITPAKGNGNGINGNLIRVNNTAKTRRPHPRSNSNTDRVPSKSKSSCLSNNVEKIEENHRNSQIPKNQKHMSSECNNITLAIRNAKSEIVCVMCKQCLVTANHDVCVLNYVNNMNSRADNQSANVSIRENQKKHKANAKKSKELGSKGSLASSRPSKPRTCLRWIPTGRIFAMCGKLTASSNTENKSEKSMCDNASTSNPSEPSSKGFPISTSLLGRLSRLRKQHTSIYPIVVL
ncbi:hypothetical protein Tco_1456218 [Tanacetum coccineum]